ncbi:hypothetical protein XENOCAPTIV_007772, partial [Xenoophorus captivus]
PRSEIHSGLPAPPQMPLPEIPHPWLVSLTFFIFDFFSHVGFALLFFVSSMCLACLTQQMFFH